MTTEKFSYEAPELEEAKYGAFIAGESNDDFGGDIGEDDAPEGSEG